MENANCDKILPGVQIFLGPHISLSFSPISHELLAVPLYLLVSLPVECGPHESGAHVLLLQRADQRGIREVPE